tara:strand:+ start:894 stop:1400 length:507 start_codon:yes stop_codon:yes gene_type:complete
MPIDLRLLGDEGKALFREWKNKVDKHNKYTVKNKYHKEQKMDMWHKELNELNDHYRKALKAMESDKKKEMMELEKAAKEAKKMAEEAEKMAKEERALKRKMNKEKKQAELSKMAPRRSTRLAKKIKKPRCPNGTRRSMKSGNCEKKSLQTRKRCPNGTRKNNKSGKCE